MPNKARKRWREQKKIEQLDKKTAWGVTDLTPRNAVALIGARNDRGKVAEGYTIDLR